MNHRVISLALAIVLFVCAYRIFDWNDGTHMTISLLLFLSGVHWLFYDSESPKRRQLGQSCLRMAGVISVFFIIKLIIFG
jgi:hypothetical protein